MRGFWKKTGNLFRQRWFIALIGVIALSILIWFAGYYLAIADYRILESATVRLLLIVALFILWGAFNLQLGLRRRSSERQLEAAVAESDDETDAASDEISVLSDRLRGALTTLKRGSGQRFGKRYLYELPWYIFIGPPGTGKTQAITHSGLELPLADDKGRHRGVEGVGGTRNCDWWFTDQAVFLDTAGRYTTQDSSEALDRGAWQGFLHLLRRHRPRQPINGVIAAISAEDFMVQTREERNLNARAIGQRVQELINQLGLEIPVYVLITKIDLVAGFREFFEDLSREDREQVWGMTFPWANAQQGRGAVEDFSGEFDRLVERLHERLLARLHDERDLERRARMFSFPQRIVALKQPLDAFLDEAFSGNRYRRAPLVRGVYFSSAVQQGTPLDRLPSLVEGEAPAMPGTPANTDRPYFIKRLFRDLILGEAGLVGTNRRAERQRAWLQRGAYAGAIGLAMLCALAWTVSFSRNQLGIGEVDRQVTVYQTQREETDNASARPSDVLAQMNALRQARDAFDASAPWSSRMGLYQGGDLRVAAEAAYARALQQTYLPAVARALEDQLESNSDDPEYQFEALRIYLMLGLHEHLVVDDVVTWMNVGWQDLLTEREVDQLNTHLTTALDGDAAPAILDAPLVAEVRDVLNQVPKARRGYLRLQREARSDFSGALSLPANVGDDWSLVFSGDDSAESLQIPRLYTTVGYREFAVPRSLVIAKDIAENDWVLEAPVRDTEPADDENTRVAASEATAETSTDDEPEAGTDEGDAEGEQASGLMALAPESRQLAVQIRDYYIDDYIQRWERLLNTVTAKHYDSLSAASTPLASLSSPDSPLVGVLRVLRQNTQLETASNEERAEQAAAGVDAATKTGRIIGGRASRLASVADRGRRAAEAANVGALSDSMASEQPSARVAERFEPYNSLLASPAGQTSQIDDVTAALRKLSGYVEEVTGGPGGTSGASLTAAASRMSGDGNNALTDIRSAAARLPAPVSTWLQTWSGSTGGLVLSSAREELNRVWRNSVYDKYRRTIAGRYPFSADASAEVALGDFRDFFGPNGTLATFVDNQLAPFIDRASWQWRSVDGKTIDSSRYLLLQLRRAEQIRAAFFSSDGSINVPYTLEPLSLSANVGRFTLNVGGKQIEYRHGPQIVSQLEWPSANTTQGVSAIFDTVTDQRASESTDGTWAWFRMLDRSLLDDSASGDAMRVRFNAGDSRAVYELRASSVDNAFQMSTLRNFRLPSGIN